MPTVGTNSSKMEITDFPDFSNKIYTTLERIEIRVLNPAGYFPVMSTATGCARGMLGVAQIIVGLAIAIAEWSFKAYDGEELSIWNTGTFVLCHGVANLARSGIEIIPFINLLTLAYDGDGSRQSKEGAARFSYNI